MLFNGFYKYLRESAIDIPFPPMDMQLRS